jgi:hypothetical protein
LPDRHRGENGPDPPAGDRLDRGAADLGGDRRARRDHRARLQRGSRFTGLTQILDGFPFPADCQKTIEASCYARDVAGELSWRDAAHGWIFFGGAIALQLSVFAIAWHTHGDKRWGRFDRFALFAGIAGLLIYSGLSLVGDNEPGGHYGLVQRLALAAGGLWVLILSLGLLVVRDRSGSTRPARPPGALPT